MGKLAGRTPRDLLAERGQLAAEVVAFRSDGRVTHLHTPVSEHAELRPLRRADQEALSVMYRATADAFQVSEISLTPSGPERT